MSTGHSPVRHNDEDHSAGNSPPRPAQHQSTTTVSADTIICDQSAVTAISEATTGATASTTMSKRERLLRRVAQHAHAMLGPDDVTDAPSGDQRNNATHERLMQWGKSREAAVARAKAAMEQRSLQACTFKPAVSPSPAHPLDGGADYRDPSIPVEERLAILGRQAAEAREQLRRAKLHHEDVQCTFQPDIAAHTSSRDTASSQGAIDASAIAATSAASAASPPRPPAWEPVNYVPVESRTTSSRVCHALGTDWHRELDEECTFHPRVGPLSHNVYVVSRLEEGALNVFERLYSRSLAARSMQASFQGDRHHASPSRERWTAIVPMPDAVAEELRVIRSRLGVVAGDDDDEMAAFIANIATVTSGTEAPVQLVGGSQDVSTSEVSESAEGTRDATAAKESAARFNEFIERQRALVRKRKENVAKLESTLYPPHHVAICEHSRHLVGGHRVDYAKLATKKPPPPVVDKNCSFHPVISTLAAKMLKRDGHAMYSDARHREKQVQELATRRQDVLMRECTFEPRINDYGSGDGEGKSKGPRSYLSGDQIQTYLNRVKARHEKMRQENERRREEAERAECTFQPNIHAAPTYLQRMSMSSLSV